MRARSRTISSAVEVRNTPSWAERRRRGRVAVEIGVIVRERRWHGHRAVLIDLSRNGCRVREITLGKGDRVWVTLDGLSSIEATVTWFRDGESGICFDVPLHAAVFDYLVAKNGGGAPCD